MGTYEELKAAIQQVIWTNGNNEITGALLQNALLSIVNVVGANATFAGIATPNTNPGTADQNVFYLAAEAGTYVNFGGIKINMGEAVILSNKTGNWVKTTSGFATQQQLTELESEVSKASIKESTYDFSISDEQGNAIMGIANGHIKTKNFDSRSTFMPQDLNNEGLCDLAITDDKNNILVEFLEGHIKTKNFDSRIKSGHYGSFSIIGDSYSTFADKTTPTTNKQWYPTNVASAEGYNSGNDVVSLEQTWWYLFANEYKSVLLENNSYSGATICYDGYSEGHDSFAAKISFCKRIEEMQSKPELLFVFGGTNDAWAKSEIGSYKYSDWTEDDKSYFRPALAYLIDYVRTNMIGTTIIFILNNGLKSDITDSVRVICEHYGVRVVELEDIDKISSHPSIRGMEQIKEQLIKVI